MRALCWQGVDELGVEDVPDARLQNDGDVVVKVSRTTTCGSDLHLIGGYIPFMQEGDVLGHEFVGEVVEVGPAVQRHSVGDRVVVSSFIACGSCWPCSQERYSQCDNGNPNPLLGERLWGQAPGGCFGYSHVMGGYQGSHAEYVRVPFADVGAFRVPDEVSDERALFASDSVPTGWMGADLGGVSSGDVVAVWGAGAVGQMAARAAVLLGAERVVVVDRLPERLAQVRDHVGAETIDYRSEDVGEALLEMTAGRGVDVAIEAVGMEAAGRGLGHAYDQVKQQLRLQTDRPTAVREAVLSTRKGGSVFVLGVFALLADKFPLGAVVNKGLTLRGAQMHGQRYIPMLLERMARDEIRTEHLATHTMPLEQGAEGYAMFKAKTDGCVRSVFLP